MLYNQGVMLSKIQRLLGHKSVLTTERYLGVKFEETREAILMIDARLTRALSISADSSKTGERAEVLPITSSGLLN